MYKPSKQHPYEYWSSLATVKRNFFSPFLFLFNRNWIRELRKINPLILVEKSSQLGMRIMCFVTRMQLSLSLGSSHGKPLTPIVVSLIFILAFAGWRWRPGIPENWEPVPLGLTWTWLVHARSTIWMCMHGFFASGVASCWWWIDALGAGRTQAARFALGWLHV